MKEFIWRVSTQTKIFICCRDRHLVLSYFFCLMNI